MKRAEKKAAGESPKKRARTQAQVVRRGKRQRLHGNRQNGNLPEGLNDQNARQTGRHVEENVESLLSVTHRMEATLDDFFSGKGLILLSGIPQGFHVREMKGRHFLNVDRPVGLCLHDCNVTEFKKIASDGQKYLIFPLKHH